MVGTAQLWPPRGVRLALLEVPGQDKVPTTSKSRRLGGQLGGPRCLVPRTPFFPCCRQGLFLRRGTRQCRRHRHGPSPPMLAASAPCARLEQELVPGRLGSESALSLQQSSGMQGGGLVRTAEREAGRCVSFFSNLLRGTDRAVEHSAPSKKRQSSPKVPDRDREGPVEAEKR